MALPLILSGLVSSIGSYFTNRQTIKAEEKKRKDELSSKNLEARIERIRNSTEADIKADSEARSFAGYMDNISFYIFMSPYVLSFYPPAVPHVTAGFEAIKNMPIEWKYITMAMLASVWGYKRLIVPVFEKWIEKKYGAGR